MSSTKPKEKEEAFISKPFSSNLSLEDCRLILSNFANERDWNQYHSPRNLLLALNGEIGELCEIFQWKGEVKAGLPSFTENEKIHVGEEISDILSYLIRFSDRCGIDLTKAFKNKINQNKLKYPIDKFKGSNKKYNYYQIKQNSKNEKNIQNTNSE